MWCHAVFQASCVVACFVLFMLYPFTYPVFLTSQVVGVAGLSDNFHSETFIFVVPPFSRLCCVFPPSGMCGLCHVQHLTWTVCFLRSKGISLFTETTRVFKWHFNHFMMSPRRLNKQKTVVEKECTNCKQLFLKTWRFSTYIYWICSFRSLRIAAIVSFYG